MNSKGKSRVADGLQISNKHCMQAADREGRSQLPVQTLPLVALQMKE